MLTVPIQMTTKTANIDFLNSLVVTPAEAILLVLAVASAVVLILLRLSRGTTQMVRALQFQLMESSIEVLRLSRTIQIIAPDYSTSSMAMRRQRAYGTVTFLMSIGVPPGDHDIKALFDLKYEPQKQEAAGG